jgi:hypothetical protein
MIDGSIDNLTYCTRDQVSVRLIVSPFLTYLGFVFPLPRDILIPGNLRDPTPSQLSSRPSSITIMEKIFRESRDPLLPECTCESPIHWNEHEGYWQSIRSWLRTNFLLSSILILLIYIAVVVTIDVAVHVGRIPSVQAVDDDDSRTV